MRKRSLQQQLLIAAGQVAAYGALGLPLAFAALPVYVYAPKFYAGLGMTLGVAGAVLLASRVADAFVDPWLGVLADRTRNTRAFIAASLIPLALGMLAMFNPPAASGGGLALWLCLSLTLTTLGFRRPFRPITAPGETPHCLETKN